MSRAASWQVLNQGFQNLNNAMATIMRNKEAQRRMDLYEQFGNLDRAFRAQQAAQAQDNLEIARLDRLNAAALAQQNLENHRAYQASKDELAQKNWQQTFNAARAAEAQAQDNWEKQFNASLERMKTQDNNAVFRNLIEIADKFGADVANTYEAAQRGDPIARNMLIAGIGEAKKNAQLQNDYRNLLNHKRALELIEARKAGDGQTTENPQSNTGNLIKNLSNLNKNLDSWYWTSAGRQEDENKKNLTIYNIAQNINSVDALKEFTQSKILSEQDAQQIAKIKGWIK